MKQVILIVTCIFFSTSAFSKAIDYKSAQETYEGFVINKGSKAPTVFLVHDWDGLTDYEVKRSEMLAELGYSVFAIDLFGKGVRPEKIEDRRQHTGELYKDREKMRRLLRAAYKTAKEQGLNVKNSAAMGYCFGGAAVLEWARSGDELVAFSSFHGGLKTPEGQNYKDAKGEVFVFHGTADSMISMQEFGDLGAELEAADVPHVMASFGGAPHAFTVFGSDRYREKADKKSWNYFASAMQGLLKP